MQPPASPSALGASLYEAFYGLKERPFALTSDPRFLFMSGAHRRAYEELVTGLRRREGILILTGETGTGKTTLARAVLESMGPRTFSALVLNPYMTGAEVVRVLLRDFKLVSRDDIRSGSFERADMPQLLDTLEQFLRSLLPLDSHAVVIIDEAQSLAPDVLDQLRMLGAYEQDGQSLLQIVLCGQPQLLATLHMPAMKALDERVTRRLGLGPLPASEVEGYIKHRIGVAGRADAVTFEPDAVRLIAQMSKGVPRRINLLCDRALEEGRAAGTTVIGAALIGKASRAPSLDSGTAEGGDTATTGPAEAAPEEPAVTPAPWWKRPLVLASIGGGLAVVLLAAGLYGWSIASRDPGVPASPKKPVLSGLPAKALPTPTDDEIRTVLDGTWVPGSGASGQFPDDRDQLD